MLKARKKCVDQKTIYFVSAQMREARICRFRVYIALDMDLDTNGRVGEQTMHIAWWWATRCKNQKVSISITTHARIHVTHPVVSKRIRLKRYFVLFFYSFLENSRKTLSLLFKFHFVFFLFGESKKPFFLFWSARKKEKEFNFLYLISFLWNDYVSFPP